ncbi:helix-turn-helix domain-containing protein [Actinoplanes subglobosus]|uniref:Helix-turn-helix domain-containing protein n=1 Tax=Actinoplanes subglobosus TaxID=1547892 RepID=A0ABV8IVA9_9ACTN
MSIMATTDDAEYALRVQAFARELRRLHREAGEPSLRDLQRSIVDYYRDRRQTFSGSRSSISRYLNGKSLPRGAFIDAFLDALNLSSASNRARLIALRTAAREVRDPIDADFI